MFDPGRILITVGIVFVITGLLVVFFGKIPWLGRLPGDIFIKKDNFTFFFPITTCILISVLFSLILLLWNRK